MKLEDMSIKALLEVHNNLAEKPAGSKSFKTKTDLIARIHKLQPDQAIPKQPLKSERHVATPTKKATGTESADTPKKQRGPGVGECAKALILETTLAYGAIADRINREIAGAKATKASVSWYASKMRKEGTEVPRRTSEVALIKTKVEKVLINVTQRDQYTSQIGAEKSE